MDRDVSIPGETETCQNAQIPELRADAPQSFRYVYHRPDLPLLNIPSADDTGSRFASPRPANHLPTRDIRLPTDPRAPTLENPSFFAPFFFRPRRSGAIMAHDPAWLTKYRTLGE